MATVTIRVPAATHERLRELAARRGKSIGAVVDEAARKLEDADFWDEVYERLGADPVASAAYNAEIQALDAASLADFDEPPYEGIDELIAATERVKVTIEPRLPENEGIEELVAAARDRATVKA